jgi:Rieske 2Fe-2S family protein
VRKQYSDEPAFGCTISHIRYALFEGYQTGSIDGQACAPLMGDFSSFDGGAGDFQFGPVSAMLNYPDYCVIYRFLPLSIQLSEIEVVWLVRGDAMEGKDYQVERLIEMWDVTTKEDELIIRRNQEGINSLMYQPGPRSEVFEQLNMNFTRWYLQALNL